MNFTQKKSQELISIQDLPDAFEEYTCLQCGKDLSGAMLSTGAHHHRCAWNHYFTCFTCGYQNNLAKLAKLGCTCPENWEANSRSRRKNLQANNSSTICQRCHRGLTDPKSIARGIGPKCWKKLIRGVVS